MLAQNFSFLRVWTARKTSQKALSLFEQAKTNLAESSEIALAVAKSNAVKIAALQKEADEMKALAESNNRVIKNIDTNLLGQV